MHPSIEEAKKRYPVGTRFNSTGGNTNCLVEADTQWELRPDYDIVLNKPDGVHVIGRVYSGNLKKWAEIISVKPEVQNQYEIF